VAFGCDTGAIAVVYPDAVCAKAERTATIHTLAHAKENVVASMNVLEVFMAFPFGVRGQYLGASVRIHYLGLGLVGLVGLGSLGGPAQPGLVQGFFMVAAGAAVVEAF